MPGSWPLASPRDWVGEGQVKERRCVWCLQAEGNSSPGWGKQGSGGWEWGTGVVRGPEEAWERAWDGFLDFFKKNFCYHLKDWVGVSAWTLLSLSLLQIGTDGMVPWAFTLIVLQKHSEAYQSIHKAMACSGDSVPLGPELGLGICISWTSPQRFSFIVWVGWHSAVPIWTLGSPSAMKTPHLYCSLRPCV